MRTIKVYLEYWGWDVEKLMDGGKFGKGRIVPRDNGRRARLGRAVFGEIRATAGIVGIDAEAGRGRKRGSLLDAVTLYINFTCLPIPYIHPTSSLVHPYARPSIARSILTHCPFPLPTSLLFRTVNLSFLFRSSRFLRLLPSLQNATNPPWVYGLSNVFYVAIVGRKKRRETVSSWRAIIPPVDS